MGMMPEAIWEEESRVCMAKAWIVSVICQQSDLQPKPMCFSVFSPIKNSQAPSTHATSQGRFGISSKAKFLQPLSTTGTEVALPHSNSGRPAGPTGSPTCPLINSKYPCRRAGPLSPQVQALGALNGWALSKLQNRAVTGERGSLDNTQETIKTL